MAEGTNGGIRDDAPEVDEHGALLQQFRYDYAGRCWWCGQTADSKEHKHKKSEVKRQLGQGPYTRGVTEQGQHKLYPVQGPDSIQLKFSEVLCGICNSTRSQAADLAYDKFSEYIAAAAEQILDTGQFRWSDIFPRDWRAGRNLVTAYWLKHIGCRLAESGVEVAPALGAYIDAPGSLRPVPVRMELEIREDIAEMQQTVPTGGLWLGDMLASYSRSQGRITFATSHLGQGWLRMSYEYDTTLRAGSANFWCKTVHLPRRRSVSPEEMSQASAQESPGAD